MHQGYEYSRSGNPTRTAVETVPGVAGGSAPTGSPSPAGWPPRTRCCASLAPGGGVVLGNDAYGGTFRLIADVWCAAAASSRWRRRRPHRCRRARRRRGPTTPRWCGWRRPTNPLLTCVDIAAVAAVAHDRGARVVVDNTFATPYLQQPLALGADIVVHSATKYLGGHSDVVGGFVAVDDDDLAERLALPAERGRRGAGPFDCYLVLRGVKTLAVRMDRHCANARAVVELLRRPPPPSSGCYYPRLADHPGHAVAAKQMSDFGGMVSFTVRGGEPTPRQVRRRHRRCSRSPSRSARSRA